MGVKFLSDEWIRVVRDKLNSSPAIANSSGSAKVQQVVTTPDGDKRYWFKLEQGQVQMGAGEALEPVDATITNDYETAVALSRNQLNPVAAFMSGRVRINGNVMKLMQLQGVFAQMPMALRDLEVEY